MKAKYIIICALVAVLSACGNNEKKDSDNAASEENTQTATASVDNMTRDDDNVIELTDDNALAPGKSLGKVTVIDFNASWCMPCQRFAPAFHSVAAKTKDADFISVDIDKCPATATAFGVESVPTIIIIGKNGKELRRFVGIADVLPEENFQKIVNENL